MQEEVLDEYVDEEDEEEYDSEMDDFIDDEYSEDEEVNASQEIRKLFKYDPKKYAGRDDDIDDMETDYHTMQKEERMSLRLGVKEDEEARREEEREAYLRKRRLEKQREMARVKRTKK